MTTNGGRRVLVLGAGAQGNVVGRVLSRADDVGTLVLADLDRRRLPGGIDPRLRFFGDRAYQHLALPLREKALRPSLGRTRIVPSRPDHL